MLTGRENTRRLFAGDRPERAGFTDNPWGATVRKWVAQGYPTKTVTRTVKETVVEDGREVEREVQREEQEPVSPAEHFDFDMIGVGGWYDMMPIRGVNEIVEETDEWKVVRNGSGALLKWWKHKDGTPEHVAFDMTSRAVWEAKYRPHVLAVEPDRVDVEGARKALEQSGPGGKWTFYGTLFLWEHMRRSLGDLCLYESMVNDPDWIHDIGRVYTDHLIGHYKILLAEAGVPDGMWIYEDLGYKQRLFASPKAMGELIFPYYKEVVDFLHGYGMKVVLHSCGCTMEALPLIVEAGFDGLHPMEVAAGNDIFRAAETYGDKLVFVGGFDKRILESHDRERIRREVKAFMRGMKERGARFFFASDHSISTNTDYGDFQAMVEAYREEMLY
jgi:uroporphyrinogen decarboxylase